MRNSKPILLVEADRAQALMVELALKHLKITNQLVHIMDGKEALAYLRKEAIKKPCLILLDLTMPKVDGIEFLKNLNADDTLKNIPILVLVMSEQVSAVVEAFKLNVTGYIVKPVDYKKLGEALRTIDIYWTLSELPNDQ